MKSLNGKLLLSAVGIALLATPAYAHKPLHHKHHIALHKSLPRQYVQKHAAPPRYFLMAAPVQRRADPPRYFLMATNPPAPVGYDLEHYYYPGDY
jgi:hypothetical protein